ncbi:hypothetical protein CVT26_014536 [Gymnopilus dilepis]|uniref:Uncharacterized protein n=1 Tax=Gymnopilus dilepis TaxID=231916 RepID=A0A409W399_9AGAR|nr:hypothetical protein CVT26_014536 [Gymnopilus dilepis]
MSRCNDALPAQTNNSARVDWNRALIAVFVEQVVMIHEVSRADLEQTVDLNFDEMTRVDMHGIKSSLRSLSSHGLAADKAIFWAYLSGCTKHPSSCPTLEYSC